MPQPIIPSVDGKRQFAAFAAAVVAFIVDEQERLLLLAHPKRAGAWEVISGALEAEETVLDGVLRETREEAGPHIQVRPLGPVHIASFRYDDNVPHMLSLNYLLAYEGGVIEPGDDMTGSEYRWWTLAELEASESNVIIPRDLWLLRRAIELYRLWQDTDFNLQPTHKPLHRPK